MLPKPARLPGIRFAPLLRPRASVNVSQFVGTASRQRGANACHQEAAARLWRAKQINECLKVILKLVPDDVQRVANMKKLEHPFVRNKYNVPWGAVWHVSRRYVWHSWSLSGRSRGIRANVQRTPQGELLYYHAKGHLCDFTVAILEGRARLSWSPLEVSGVLWEVHRNNLRAILDLSWVTPLGAPVAQWFKRSFQILYCRGGTRASRAPKCAPLDIQVPVGPTPRYSKDFLEPSEGYPSANGTMRVKRLLRGSMRSHG